eukprot:CAMPEP_0118971062 /NCGR_PEP_ID=MMETSP1173-20130426/7799_1 /TAXON_ID=1034831 /ORGANISM="Rhizochromulina marina cf, Strain CCMP1243" /LENGTH=246 /DNA_ID=CAMNT_0006920491 /DNA_START=162 /DNA_END=902 /DNA_ORIENTATION=+
MTGLLLLVVPAAHGLLAPGRSRALLPRRLSTSTRLRMVSVPERTPMIVTGNNVEMTPTLKDYAHEKIEKVVGKHREYILKTDIHLTVTRNPSVKNAHIAEATVSVKGNTIRSSHHSENMYASIDMMADGLARKLRKYKERRTNQMHASHGHSALREVEDPELEEMNEVEDDFADYQEEAATYGPAIDMDIVKNKKFKMDPITAEEAVLCLEYIDHPFYVFRNSETGDINVVYKRNHGGVGLIEPDA